MLVRVEVDLKLISGRLVRRQEYTLAETTVTHSLGHSVEEYLVQVLVWS